MASYRLLIVNSDRQPGLAVDSLISGGGDNLWLESLLWTPGYLQAFGGLVVPA